MPTFGISLDAVSINPGNRLSHHTEIQVIGHCISGPVLAASTAIKK